jgi:hypothetical protein
LTKFVWAGCVMHFNGNTCGLDHLR